MKYVMLSTLDSLPNVGVFREDRNGLQVVRPMYVPFACRGCGKIDEMNAFRACGLASDLDICRSVDISFTSDGWLLVRRSTLESWVNLGVKGLRVVAENDAVRVVMPAPVGVDVAQYESHSECAVCRRPSERFRVPLLDSMALPADDMMVFGPEVLPESVLGTSCLFILSATVKKLVRQTRGVKFDWML